MARDVRLWDTGARRIYNTFRFKISFYMEGLRGEMKRGKKTYVYKKKKNPLTPVIP